MKKLALALVAILATPAALAVTADDVVCDKCVQQKDLAFGAVGTGRLQKQSVTTDRIATGAVGAGQIKTGQVQKRVTGECPPGHSMVGVGQDGSVTCQRTDIEIFYDVAVNSDINVPVVTVACPANSLPIGVGCGCDYVNGSRNFGVLFACDLLVDGAGAACFDEALSFDPNKPPPQASVTVVCGEQGPVQPTQLSTKDEFEQIRKVAAERRQLLMDR